MSRDVPTHRRYLRLAALAGGLAALAIATPGTSFAAPPPPPPPATVTSTIASGMVYNGSTATTITRISLSGTTFTVDDDKPITAGVGCSPVAGDPTQARCAAPKAANGTFKLFTVKASSGNDTVFNFTSVGMIADGGLGNDTLHGSVTAGDKLSGSVDSDKLVGNGGNDTLKGGSGSDLLEGGPGIDHFFGGTGNDTMRGGDGDDSFTAGFLGGGRDGDDTIDGGPGLGDHVDYTLYGAEDGSQVSISLSTTGGFSGFPGEKDQISNVEHADGSLTLPNIMNGNDFDNRLKGGSGDDLIFGRKGADFLAGNSGDDLISSNSISLVGPVPLADGAKDRILGGADTDACAAAAEDNDFVLGCEN